MAGSSTAASLLKDKPCAGGDMCFDLSHRGAEPNVPLRTCFDLWLITGIVTDHEEFLFIENQL